MDTRLGCGITSAVSLEPIHSIGLTVDDVVASRDVIQLLVAKHRHAKPIVVMRDVADSKVVPITCSPVD